MLKREITYEDFNGDTVTDTVYFNLTRTEIVELQLTYDGGLEETIKKIIRSEDLQALIAEFKHIVLLSFGEKSADGKRFVKNDDIREAFSQTAAYDALFMELATNENAAADFIKGIIPADMTKEVEAVQLPPTPPQVS